MEIIVVSRTRGRTWRIGLEPGRLMTWLLPATALFLFAGLAFSAGYLMRPAEGLLPGTIAQRWESEISAQRVELEKARMEAQESAHALARRIALIDAHIVRLDAAGSRMTQIAHIDSGEFSFDKAPAVGGPGHASTLVSTTASPVMADTLQLLDSLDNKLANREREMKVLEELLLVSKLQKEVQPSGWPIASGYITSGYGDRTDPFTGSREYHPGIDFAAPEGTKVLAVGSGIVATAEVREGYGMMVEVNHGNGYVTRYGHNEKVLVKVGDRVQRGQAIAKIGTTGRSTGPHVHFEVLLNGSVVNPEQFIQVAR
jgi:murein DD-endopeptidase MepM/ murein hydrolase activator NlpD